MADIEVEDSDLSAIIADEIRQAQTFDQGKRAAAIEYMRGEMNDVPARANGSSQTSRDVADTISWILPGVVRVFTASDQMVEFEATQDGGEQGAEEATEYANYSFFRENDGYRVLYNATYDSLLMGNGAVCAYWCPEESKTKLFKDKTEEELALLLDEGWQGMGKPPEPGKPRLIDDPIMGQMEVPTFTVRLQMITERGQVKAMTLKPENLELSSNATTIEDARYRAYLHDDKTRSDLLEMADEYGWDKEVIRELPAYTLVEQNEVGNARRKWIVNNNSPVKSGDLMNLRECYINADKDGDGVAELLQVWTVGDAGAITVLSWDEWEDDIPFTDIPCYPVPHSWEAESVFDRTADIQRVKTVLLRQGIENLYAVNLPGQEVEEGSVLNPDALVNRKFGGIYWKKKGSAPIIPQVVPYVADKVFAALEYMDTLIAKRTGVSKTTMALDPEALQNQTATASQNQRDAGYSQIELIARNMAELGWSPFFSKFRNLVKKYVKGAVQIPSRNGDVAEGLQGEPGTASRYRSIQPEAWSDNMACTINVGLGTGSRDRDLAMLTSVQNDQLLMAKMLAEGGQGPKALEFLPKIRKTAIQKAESAGLKNPDDYYPEVTDEEVAQMVEAAKQPRPDPALIIEQAKGEVQKELKAVDAQVTMREAELKAQGEVIKNEAELQADLQTKAADRDNAIVIENIKAQNAVVLKEMDLAFQREKMMHDAQIQREAMANSAVIADRNNAAKADIAKNKPQPGASQNG